MPISPKNIPFPNPISTYKIITASFPTLNLPQPPKRFFRHGWQSWSLTSWTNPATPLPIQQPILLHPMQTDPRHSLDIIPNGSWVGAVELDENDIILLGSLGLDAHIWVDKDQFYGQYEEGDGDWLIARGNEEFVFSKYAEELGKRFGNNKKTANPRVWCSWYSLYTHIDEKRLHNIFNRLDGLPFDVLQVDDGWQVAVGDWIPNKKFPSGMVALADKIKSTGRKAGLWLAPFLVVESSRLYHEKQNWLLRDKEGQLVSAGFNWGERLFALDTTHPEVLSWLKNLMQEVRSWGYDYLKLDFLYAGALPGNRHMNLPREAAYRQGLKVIREALGEETFLLTCGTPIIPTLGLCDAIRIGPDVASTWESSRDAILLYNPTTPGVKNAIRTSYNRIWLKPLIGIDPDVAYFAQKGNSLSQPQRQLLQDLALICEFKATSDLPGWMTSNERKTLQEFLVSMPKVTRMKLGKFKIDDRFVDFSSALPLSKLPSGLIRIQAAIISWVGNHPLALKLLKQLNFILLFIRSRIADET